MAGLSNQVVRVFEPGGELDKASAGYTIRSGQVEMARAVAQALEVGGQLVVEAGTGVGKTFAYLVPVLMAGRPAVISTATRALQDQLATRDVPVLLTTLGLSRRVAVLKGRSNYICMHRLDAASEHPWVQSSAKQIALDRVKRWVLTSKTGDLAELVDMHDADPMRTLITSTPDSCHGAQCPKVLKCHVNAARQAALTADLVIINHSLLVSNLSLKDDGFTELLPRLSIVVVDEAHRLPEAFQRSGSYRLDTAQLERLVQDLLNQGPNLVLGSSEWRNWLVDLSDCTEQLKVAFSTGTGEADAGPDSCGMPIVNQSIVGSHLDGILIALNKFGRLVAHLEQASPKLLELGQRIECFRGSLMALSAGLSGPRGRWIDSGANIELTPSAMPASIGQLGSATFPNISSEHPAAWIFTSATLGLDAKLTSFCAEIGLVDPTVLKVKSPFDFPSQAALYVPKEFPLPSDFTHSIEVANLVARASVVLGGRTLVLTTTLRAMQEIGASLKNHFSIVGGPKVLVQGELPQREILASFAAGNSMSVGGYVVVASVSFWEGVDIPGDALQLVVIDKTPFAPPEALSHQASVANRNRIFQDVYIPHAAMALRQGAGRLIRRESDRGVLVVCDVRLEQRSYGQKLLSFIPPMRRLNGRVEFDAELNTLTKLSTTDSYWP